MECSFQFTEQLNDCFRAVESCASRLKWSNYHKLCGEKAYKCIRLADWFVVWGESLQNVENVSEFSKCCDRADLSKCCKGCELSMLQMLQCFLGVAGLQCLQMLQYCGSLKMLIECCRVLFLEKVFKCCRNKVFANAAEPTDVAVLSMSRASFHLDYFIMPAT